MTDYKKFCKYFPLGIGMITDYIERVRINLENNCFLVFVSLFFNQI